MVKSPNVVNKHQNTFIREMLFHRESDFFYFLVFNMFQIIKQVKKKKNRNRKKEYRKKKKEKEYRRKKEKVLK
jgi:hypothetical protein